MDTRLQIHFITPDFSQRFVLSSRYLYAKAYLFYDNLEVLSHSSNRQNDKKTGLFYPEVIGIS